MLVDAQGRLAKGEFEALAKRCAETVADGRKIKARERWNIFTENYKPLIRARLDETLTNDTYREQVEKFIDLSDNPALDVVRSTSVVWVQGARRSIAGATKDQGAALTELIAESLIDTHAPRWNQIAEFVGPIIVIPAVRKATLRWDVLLPTYYDVIPDPDDEHGTPLAVAWTIRNGRKSSKEPDVAILDGHSWRFATTAGGKLVAFPEREVVHGLGFFPGVPLRFDAPYDSDWYGPTTRHQRFVDATISVGTILAALGFTRKAQNSYLLSAVGFLGDGTKQQPLDPETGIAINVEVGPGKQPPKIETLTFDTPPKNFLDHAAGIRRSVAAAYGGTLDANGKMVFDIDALAEVRNEQIPRARVFERQLWCSAIAMCRAFRHPIATRLPDDERTHSGFSVDFGKLSRSFADPKQEADHLDWLISKGALDQIDILRMQGNQNLDDEQLKARLEANLDAQAWFNDQVTKRNLSMTAKGAQTAPQAFGALGPLVRDAAKTTAPEGADTPKPEGNEQ